MLVKINIHIRIGVYTPILLLFFLNTLNLFSLEDKYEAKIFVTDDYCLTCNSLMLEFFQRDLKFNKISFEWVITNSNVQRYEYLKSNNKFNTLEKLKLDTLNKISKDYAITNFPYIILLKNGNILYQTDSFVFNSLKEIIDYDKNTEVINLDSTLLDVKDLIIMNNTKYFYDEVKQSIIKNENGINTKIDINSFVKNNLKLKVDGDISIEKLFIVENKPVALIKFNISSKNFDLPYFEYLIDLDTLKLEEYKYDSSSYIETDNLNLICSSLIFPCFHKDYYEDINKDSVENLPLLASISKDKNANYFSTLGEVQKIINNKFIYLYILNSFSINNYLLLFEPFHGLSIYSKFDCDKNTFNEFKKFNFDNSEIQNIFNGMKVNDPYNLQEDNNSEYYFEGIKGVRKSNFALVFRSKTKNKFGFIEYILFEYTNNLHFSRKKTYLIQYNDTILNTFLISNSDNKVIIGIKRQDSKFIIYEPKL